MGSHTFFPEAPTREIGSERRPDAVVDEGGEGMERQKPPILGLHDVARGIHPFLEKTLGLGLGQELLDGQREPSMGPRGHHCHVRCGYRCGSLSRDDESPTTTTTMMMMQWYRSVVYRP